MADSSNSLISAPQHAELPPDALRWYADMAMFDFPSTAFIEPLKGIIGQQRALDAINIGAQIFSPGYNIFVSGLTGTGRLSTIKSILERSDPYCNIPHDYAFVNNFDNPDNPRLHDAMNAGAHETLWNGLTSGGTPAASGQYHYRIESNGTSETGQIVLVR